MEDSKKDIMTNIIWFELVHTQFWELYLYEYSDYSKSKIKRFNIYILVISTIGAAIPGSFKFIKFDANTIAIIYFLVFCIMIFVQIMTLVKKEILPNDNKCLDMEKLSMMYLEYLNEVESLWIKLFSGELDGFEAEKKYNELRKKVLPIENLKCSLGIKSKKWIQRHGEHEAYVRLHRKYGSEVPKEAKYHETFITKIWHRFF